MLLKSLQEKYDKMTPERNPVMCQLSRKYKHESLGDGGKLYLIRGRFHKRHLNSDELHYGVPFLWKCPAGFIQNKTLCWCTKSEALAIRYYREYGNAQNRLKKKFDAIIKEQDYFYSLSKAVDSDVELPKLKPGFEPRPHQKVAIEFGILTDGRFLIADQMRTGKSFSALLYILSEKWSKCLIVAPAKVVSIWAKMIEEICDVKYKILKSHDALEKGFNIVSYDSLHTIETLDCDIAVCDEAHFFLKGNARRSQAVKQIKADKRLALSGTMILNKAEDILAVLEWVRPKLAEEMTDLLYLIKDEDSFTKAQILSTELRRRCMLLRETSQVGTAEEAKINFIEIDTKVENPKNLQEVGRAKVDYAIDYLRSFQEKILVIFYYRETGKMLKIRLGRNALLIDGETSKKEVQNALESFEKGDVQYLIASNVIGEGIDISHCNNILIVEESSHSMRIEQIRARCSNIYKQKDVIIDILIAKDTQDDRLYEIINNKYDLQNGFKSF